MDLHLHFLAYYTPETSILQIFQYIAKGFHNSSPSTTGSHIPRDTCDVDVIKQCYPGVLPAAVSNSTALPGRDKRSAFFPPRTPPFSGARGEQTFMVVSPLNYSACVQAVAQPSLAAYCSALLHLRKNFFAHPAAVVCRFVPMPPARSRATRSHPVGNRLLW